MTKVQVDAATATTSEYYSIICPSQQSYYVTPSKVLYDADKSPNIVTLCLPQSMPMTAGVSYKLTVLGAIKDILGNPIGANGVITFTGSGADGAKPTITDAVIISNDTVKITADRDIALDITNIDPTNYTLYYTDNGTVVPKCPLFVGYINSTTLVLKFDTLDFNTAYTLEFKSLDDYSGLYTRTAADGQNSITVRMGQ